LHNNRDDGGNGSSIFKVSSMQDRDMKKSIDTSVFNSVFNTSGLSVPFAKGLVVQRSSTPVKQGFGASSPRFGTPTFRSESPILKNRPPQNAKPAMSKVSARMMENRESFDERLNRSIERLKQRKASASLELPGPGHYVLPTDALLMKETKAAGGTTRTISKSNQQNTSRYIIL